MHAALVLTGVASGVEVGCETPEYGLSSVAELAAR
jgi:hypothetical protein